MAVDRADESETIDGTAPTVAVTHAAVHVLPAGEATDAADVETLPLTTVEDATAEGVVRTTLTVDTDEAAYRISVRDRSSLSDLAKFLRRASWSWRRVRPRLEEAGEAIDRLSAGEADDPRRAIDRASMAISTARSSLDRLEVAVDAIEAEIDSLHRDLARQRGQYHLGRAQSLHSSADEAVAAGRLSVGLERYRDAKDHYQAALSVAFEQDIDGADRIRSRLEATRESMYDVEASPIVAAESDCRRAASADDPEARREAWAQARDRYREARADAECPVPEAWLDYQLAWVEANYCRAARAYAVDLEANADAYVADGHGQWAAELYGAAADALGTALSVAEANPVLSTDALDADRDRIADKRSQRWGSITLATAGE